MKNINIKAFNILNQNGNPAANQIETIITGEGINMNQFQSYNSIIAQIDYTPETANTLTIDKNAYNHSTTTTKHLNMWMQSHYIDPKEAQKIAKKGGGVLIGKYRNFNIIVEDLNN